MQHRHGHVEKKVAFFLLLFNQNWRYCQQKQKKFQAEIGFVKIYQHLWVYRFIHTNG